MGISINHSTGCVVESFIKRDAPNGRGSNNRFLEKAICENNPKIFTVNFQREWICRQRALSNIKIEDYMDLGEFCK